MLVLDIKTKVLKLMNEYSTNGDIISNVDNSDYLNRMYDYILDAEKEISCKKAILKQVDIMTGDILDSYTQCIYPKNCKEIKYISKNLNPYTNFKTDLNFYYVPNSLIDGQVVYSKEPDNITSDTQAIETEWEPIPFYVAGMLLVDDEPSSVSNKLLGLYSSKLNLIHERVHRSIINVYGGFYEY